MNRVLRSAVEAAQAFPEGEIVVTWVHPTTGERRPRPRFHIGIADTDMTGAIEAMPLWAGESVSGVRRVQPAADIVQELASEAEALLRRWA